MTFSDIQAGDKVSFFKAASRITQDHYVERCERLFIINAPSFFSLVWRAASPLLNENTRKKISVCRKGKVITTTVYHSFVVHIVSEELLTDYTPLHN